MSGAWEGIKSAASDVGDAFQSAVIDPVKDVKDDIGHGIQQAVFDPIKDTVVNPVTDVAKGTAAGIAGVGMGIASGAAGLGAGVSKFAQSDLGQGLMGAAGAAYLGVNPASLADRKEMSSGGQSGSGPTVIMPSGLAQQQAVNGAISPVFIYTAIAAVIAAVIFMIVKKRK